jgi:hypothetical protein
MILLQLSELSGRLVLQELQAGLFLVMCGVLLGATGVVLILIAAAYLRGQREKQP